VSAASEPAVLSGVIPPNLLVELRRLREQARQGQEAQARMDLALTALIEAHGHDVAAVTLASLDLDVGAYVLARRSAHASPSPD